MVDITSFLDYSDIKDDFELLVKALDDSMSMDPIETYDIRQRRYQAQLGVFICNFIKKKYGVQDNTTWPKKSKVYPVTK